MGLGPSPAGSAISGGSSGSGSGSAASAEPARLPNKLRMLCTAKAVCGPEPEPCPWEAETQAKGNPFQNR